MALYNNSNNESPVASVELLPVAEGNFTFIRARKNSDAAQLKQWLSENKLDQTVVGETNVNGVAMLVTSGAKSRDELMDAINATGNRLALDKPKTKFNPWMWRGASSIVGQSFQLLSGFKSFKKGGSLAVKNSADNAAIIGFASANLVANGVNMAFGAQTMDDPHQLLALKKQFNEKYAKYLPPGESLIDPSENRADLLTEPTQKTVGEKAHDLGKRYSVSGGEVGLRVLGTLSLSYPLTRLKNVGDALKSGSSLSGSLGQMRNPDPFTYKVGLYTLLGKAVAFISKAPDPYNPNPPSLLDKFRENVTFRLSSIIEGAAAGVMAYDRYKNKSIMFRGKERRDWFGVAGNVVFIGGYVIRLFAPFGTREVDMQDLKAHITGTLAKMPQDKLPQLLAETAADLTQHFKGKYNYSDLYTDLATDLYRYHGVAVTSPVTGAGEEKIAEGPAKSFAQAHPSRPLDVASAQKHASYRDKVRKASEVEMMVAP